MPIETFQECDFIDVLAIHNFMKHRERERPREKGRRERPVHNAS